MALRAGKPRAVPANLECGHEALIAALREQVATLEVERDAARAGLLIVERALRRHGCCDGR